MQTNRNNRSRPMQAPRVPVGRRSYVPDFNDRSSVILLAALCLLLPPLGIVLLWHTGKVSMPVRAGLSGAGFLSMLVIFFLLMRPGSQQTGILPASSTPSYAGYGLITAAKQPEAPAQPMYAEVTAAPAMPDPAPAIPAETEPPAPVQTAAPNHGLSDNTVVFAVTNNASNYHLKQVCDTQTNNRAITLFEALNEGLTPCEKCLGAVE